MDLRFINWLPEDVHVLRTFALPLIKRLRNFVIDVNGKWVGTDARIGTARKSESLGNIGLYIAELSLAT